MELVKPIKAAFVGAFALLVGAMVYSVKVAKASPLDPTKPTPERSGTITSLPDVPGLAAMGPEFHQEFAAVCERLNFGQDVCDAIAALISHESRFTPSVKNQTGGASGLMQWMPATAKWLGTTTEAIREMSAIEQLALVEKTFQPWAGKLKARDVPMVGFGSSFIGKPDDLVAYRKGTKGYDWNTGLDLDKNEELTLGEVRHDVLKILNGKGRIPV